MFVRWRGRVAGAVAATGRRCVALLTGLAVLGGCAYRGGIDDPLVQRVSWFSYLGGNDIARACDGSAGERYRIIYNGRYDEQLRSYEIAGAGAGAELLVRVQEPANPSQASTDDILAPWGWHRAVVPLSPDEFADVRRRLAESRFFDGAPAGLVLHSKDFYWAASGCRDGVFHFYAWVHARDRFADVRFADFLIAHDPTGISINPPRPVSVIDYSPSPPGNGHEREQPGHDHFDLEIGSRGLLGAP